MLAAALLVAQQFEVASVKPSPARSGEDRFVTITADEGRIAYKNVTLKLLISIAYEMDDRRISGGGDWVESSLYDIDATLAPHTPEQQVPVMLQALLAQRLGLSIQRTEKLIPAYGLVIGKHGAKLKSAGSEKGFANIFRGRIVGRGVSADVIASLVSHGTDRPVVNKTGLPGIFDIDLIWTPDAQVSDLSQKLDGPSIFTATQEQLGLELVPQKASFEFLIVEHANRTPIEN